MVPVNNVAVWGKIRNLFLISALLFLLNIVLGFDNALTLGSIPRWQTLVHAHAGTLGWVTLSAIGLMFWLHSEGRELGTAYVHTVRVLSWTAVVVFTGYLLSFGLAFGLGRPWFYLLPLFGVSASLVIWAAAAFAFLGLRRRATAGTAHLLVAAALLVAALGSTVGVLLGLEYLTGFFLPGADRIGAHAAVMDAYVLLFAAAIVESFLDRIQPQRWTRAGLALAIVWSLAGVFVLVGLLFGSSLGFLFVPFLLLGLVLFLASSGWRALRAGPRMRTPQRWLFFGTLWATLWALFFIYIGAAYAQDLAAVPPWVAVVFQHSAFVGTMTNLLLGVYAARTQDVGNVLQGSETAALWLINLGLPLFFALEIAAGSRLGAIVMGSGVLLGVATMIVRLLLSDTRWAYELLYRWRAPWEVDGPRPELVEMVQSGRLKPCRAIDLGCGTGENVIFLAQNGFDVLGVDLSARAIAQAKAKAEAAGVTTSFLTADVTTLANGVEPFDLLLDYGCLGCVMGQPARERYAQTVARLARPGATYILLAFARDSKRHFSAIPNTLTTAEVQSLFGGRFQIEHYDARHETGPLGISVALRMMRRRETIMSE